MMTNQRAIAYDCKYFLGDRPCVWHKKEGAVCECRHYTPLQGNILVIKLDAMGDVLRTTCLLPLIVRAWPGQRITWITRPESVPLLQNNPYLDEILAYGPDALTALGCRRFDRVINLDAGRTSAGLAAIARAGEKTGYVLDDSGAVRPTNAAAEEWLRLGIFDDLKKANRRTYQEIMASILGLPAEGMRYVLELTAEEENKARQHLLRLGINPEQAVVGIHTGGGGRWRLKQWDESGFLQLVPALLEETAGKVQVLLFGGPLERELNQRMAARLKPGVFDAGCDNSVRHFAALVRFCSVLLSGDSLAMHVALSQRRRVVVLFGPTSHSEIELFGLGEKVIPDLDCLCCYKPDCDFVPNCMESISVDMVQAGLRRQLQLAHPAAPAGPGPPPAA